MPASWVPRVGLLPALGLLALTGELPPVHGSRGSAGYTIDATSPRPERSRCAEGTVKRRDVYASACGVERRRRKLLRRPDHRCEQVFMGCWSVAHSGLQVWLENDQEVRRCPD